MGASSNPLAAGVASLKPPSTTQTMISPDGQYGEIPVERVQDAIKAGFKAGMNMISPDGAMGTVPVDKAHDAMAAGFKPSGLTLPESKLYAQHPANVLYRNIRQNETPEQIAARQQTAQNASNTISNVGQGMAVAGGLVAAPVPTIAGLASGVAGQKAGTKIATAAGADQTTAQRVGDVTGLVTGVAGGMAGEAAEPAIAKVSQSISDAMPSSQMAAAGQKFNQLRGQIGNHTVNMTDKLGDALTEIKMAADSGTTLPTPVNKFVTRIADVDKGPLTYDEARNFYSNVSDLAASDKMAMNNNARRLVVKFKNALGDTISDTADAAGKLQDYQDAMQGFAKGAQQQERLEAIKDAAIKYGGPAILGGGLYTGLKTLKDLAGK